MRYALTMKARNTMGMSKKEFRERLLMDQKQRKIDKARAEDKEYDRYQYKKIAEVREKRRKRYGT